MYRDGVAVGDAAADAERTSRQSGGADDTSPADQSTHTTQQPVVYVEMSDEQAAKLQAEIKALEAKYTEYLRVSEMVSTHIHCPTRHACRYNTHTHTHAQALTIASVMALTALAQNESRR